jgi:hypothetical protein
MFIPLSFCAPAKINPRHATNWDSVLFLGINADGSLGITPTQNCTYFLKIRFVVARAGFIPIISTKGIILIMKGKLQEKS